MNETIQTILDTQKKHPEQKNFISIVTFSGGGMEGVRVRRDRVPAEKVSEMSRRDYCPSGCTPLYDAMGKSISELEDVLLPGDQVLVTIITDGYENSSCEYNASSIKTLVGRMREKGWTFVYIGANQDSIEVAKNMNIANAMNFEASPEGAEKMSARYKKCRENYSDHVDYCMSSNADAGDMEGFFGILDKLFKDSEQV